MFRTPKAGTRVLAGIATCATVIGVTIPLTALAASAAVTAITVSPSTYQANQAATVSVTGSVTHVVGELVQYAIVSGPDADQAANGTNNSDGACTLANAAAATTAFTCSIQNLKAGVSTPGTDTVRVYGGTAGSAVSAPSADATVTFNGPAANVTLVPVNGTSAAGTCNAFTATVTDAGARAVPNAAVTVIATLNPDTTGRTLNFCNTTSGAFTAAAVAGPVKTVVTTDAAGQAVVGIRSDQPGTVSVRAFADVNGNNAYDAGEPKADSTQTFTSGGTGNAAADAVSTLAVTPVADNSIATENRSYTVTAKNSSGNTLANVVVNAFVSGGPNAAVSVACANPTNNSGQVVCNYTPTAAGTDTLTFFVNQTAGATSGLDANEPRTTATNTVAAAPAGNTVAITCVGTLADPAAANANCISPTTVNNKVFTAVVTKAAAPVAGVLVRFTTVNTTAPGTPVVSPLQAVTDAKGVATTTLTDATEANNTVDSVTATIAGQAAGAGTAITGTVTFQTPVTKTLVLAPKVNTAQTGSASTFVATATDQFGALVPAGTSVDFTFGGGSRNVALSGTGNGKLTDATGKATFTYTDAGAVAAPGTDTITARATLTPAVADTATNQFVTEPVVAGTIDIDVTGAGTCGVTTVDPANNAKSYDPTVVSHSVCAVVKTAGNQPLAGKTVTFTLSGVGSFVSAAGVALTSPQTGMTDGNGVVSLFVTSTKSGAQNLTASIDGKSQAGTITYNPAAATSARNIAITPKSGSLPTGQTNGVTALVTDVFGNPVQGVNVDFAETGPVRFTNGTSSVSGVTGATGVVSVSLASTADTTASDTVSASIGTPGTQCSQLVGAGNNSSATTTAGNCTASNTYTFADPVVTPPTSGPVLISGDAVVHPTYNRAFVITGTAPANSVVVLNFHKSTDAAGAYPTVRNVTADAAGNWKRSILANVDYRYFANVGTSVSNNVLNQPSPVVSGDLKTVVAKNKTYTLRGTAVPGSTVYIAFHKAGTAADDYSIVRSVTANSAGDWTRPVLASVDYRLFVARDSGGNVAGHTTYLYQAR